MAVFPEATTSDGSGVLNFKPALFQAAIDAESRICPIAIRYGESASDRAPYTFLGETSLIASMVMIARADGIVVTVSVLGDIHTHPGSDRVALAFAAHDAILRVLQR